MRFKSPSCCTPRAYLAQPSSESYFFMYKDWNASYEQGEIPWDKGVAAPPLRAFLATHSIAGRVLVPGCGLGHDVRLLAEQGASVVGLDIAAEAVRQAQAISSVGEVCFEVADFLNLPSQYHQQFDAVVEHTCLCALDREQRTAYARSVQQALKPGGTYLAIFYRLIADYDGSRRPHPISAEEIEILFGDVFEMIERVVPDESYPSRPLGSEEVCLMRKRVGR